MTDTRPSSLAQEIARGADRFIAEARDAIAAERRRVIEEEGRSPEGDDRYLACELGLAGNAYLRRAQGRERGDDKLPDRWPWPAEWWKPRTIERDLVRAGQLFQAERERLDRQEPSQVRSRRLFNVELLYNDAVFALSYVLRDRAERTMDERVSITAYLRHLATLRPADAHGLRVAASDVEARFHHDPELNPPPTEEEADARTA